MTGPNAVRIAVSFPIDQGPVVAVAAGSRPLPRRRRRLRFRDRPRINFQVGCCVARWSTFQLIVELIFDFRPIG